MITHLVVLIVGIGLGVGLTVIFEWYTWAQDLLPDGRDDD
jgi:hypothetical protein